MKVIAKSRNGKMLKIGEGEKDAKWYFLDEPVVKFVESSVSNGDEVTIKYNQSGGKATITYLTKGKGESQQTTKEEKPIEKAKAPEKEAEYKCSDCGVALKDGKYQKCFKCNQKNPSSSNTGVSGTAKDNLIKREAIGHMVSRSLISLQGQVDEKNIHQLIKSIYVTYLNLIDQK